MQSKTSFFNRTVFWNDLKRWWPLTAGYTLLWLMILPLSRLTNYRYVHGGLSVWNKQYETLNITVIGGYWSAFFVGILFAMAAFSYLTNARATNGLHALPARRETLFVTHYLAGLCSQLAPQFLAVALTALVLGSHGAFDARVTGLMLLAFLLPTVFFYSFGVLCMVFTGQILAAPVFYGALNVVVVSVETLARAFAGEFLYGWAEPASPSLMVLSPIVKLVELDIRAIGTNNEYYQEGNVSGVRMVGTLMIRGLEWLWIYAAVGIVLAVVALLVYRRRHSEATGSIVAIYWARPIFQYGVTFCAALALGQLVYYIFFSQYYNNGVYSLPGLLLCMAAAGLIGYFGAEMLLKKSFRVWKSGWRGAAAVTASLIALGVVMTFDLTGYEEHIPDPESVDEVYVDLSFSGKGHYCSYTATKPDTIRLVEAAHRAIVADKVRQQALGLNRDTLVYDESEQTTYASMSVSYQLKNGGMVRRKYSYFTIYKSELDDPASPAAALTALYNDPDVTVSRALGFHGEEDPRTLEDLRFTGGYYDRSKWSGDEYMGEVMRDLSPTEAQQLYDAILRDVAAGHAATSLFEGEGERPLIELYATCVDVRDDTIDATRPVEDDGRRQLVFDVRITPNMTEVLAVLEAIGID